jgi:outer membrane lipopolysaccharide assembly protein LptE/RlpB
MRVKSSREDSEFEKQVREYLNQAKIKLNTDLKGTREAIRIIAQERAREFVQFTDRGLDKDEIKYFINIITSSMCQSFCYGYGIGKLEGVTSNKLFL